MRRCELCKTKARMHCASDQANLCWDCDATVHSANFLVAKHSRNLLCSVCQSPTSWSASGGKLRPTVYVCEQCVDQELCDNNRQKELEVEADEGDQIAEDNQNNQISPPPIESTSSDDESVSSRDTVISRKRYQIKETNRRSPPNIYSSQHTTFSKSKKESTMVESGRVEVYGSTILDSLRRLHREDMGSEQETMELCALP